MISKSVIWPLTLAVCFFCLPLTAFYFYPMSFWAMTDNEPLGLSNGLNMAYRLADFTLYPAAGMTNHPGVPLYLMGWLSLGLTGHPIARGGLDFFREVAASLETYQFVTIMLASFTGATAIFIFARAASRFSAFPIIVVAISYWLISTPATIENFTSPSHESFAMLINALFFSTLVLLAFETQPDWSTVVIAGGIAALAYLNKLSYLYIFVAFGGVIFLKCLSVRTGFLGIGSYLLLFIFSFLVIVFAVALDFIEWSAFKQLIQFQEKVLLSSGLYGSGDSAFVSVEDTIHAFQSIPGDRAYALPLALVFGAILIIAGMFTLFRRPLERPAALLACGTGAAAVFAATAVLKHYAFRYTAGVSATLPACIIAGAYLMRNWKLPVRAAAFGALSILAIFMSARSGAYYLRSLTSIADTSVNAKLDTTDIAVLTAGETRQIEYTYRTPFAQYGEGFLINYAAIPRLTDGYLRDKRQITNSLSARYTKNEVGLYIVDKNYFRTVVDVKNASNLDPLGPQVVRWDALDKVTELRTVFVLEKPPLKKD